MISKILTFLYWPIVGIYSIFLVIFTILYFTEMENWTNRSYYNWMNFKRLVIPAIFLTTSLIARYQENQKMANILLYIPVAFIVLLMMGGLFILLLYSRSNR